MSDDGRSMIDPNVTPWTAFWKWSSVGGVVAAILIIAQASSVGGPAGLLQVGEVSPLVPLIEAELREVPTGSPNNGHDTQTYFAIALDLSGSHVPDLFDSAPYRYRRILYPALASLLGVLNGPALLGSMIAITVASTALATGLTAMIARQRGRSDWLALAVLLNPGVWLSIRLITADILALFFMLLGLHCLLSDRKWAPWAFALSGLAKEIYLLTPGGLAISRGRRRWSLIVIPGVALTGWMTWLNITMGNAFTDGHGNVGWPLAGIIEASSVWSTVEATDLFYLAFALLSVGGGLIYAAFFKSWLRLPILAWSVIGVASSSWVWDLGNNAARVFAPIVVLVVLSTRQPDNMEASPTRRSVKLGVAEALARSGNDRGTIQEETLLRTFTRRRGKPARKSADHLMVDLPAPRPLASGPDDTIRV